MSENPLRLVQLRQEGPIPFDCGDTDLNDFFSKDWYNYYRQLLAVTYCLYLGNDAVAMVSLFNDRIDAKSIGRYRKIPFQKRHHHSWPAVKIGRFAVCQQFKRQKFGTDLMTLMKAFFLIRNKTGCRFLTVDAYPDAVLFYEKCGFKYMKPFEATARKWYWKALRLLKMEKQIEGQPNLLMYFDLIFFQEFLTKNPEQREGYQAQFLAMMHSAS